MQNSNEDMLLSQEEINKIAERISKDASERLTKELERALKRVRGTGTLTSLNSDKL